MLSSTLVEITALDMVCSSMLFLLMLGAAYALGYFHASYKALKKRMNEDGNEQESACKRVM